MFHSILALVALRYDALNALARASAPIPSHGRRRLIDYRALANREGADAGRILRGAEVPVAGHRAAIGEARAVAAGVLRSLDLTGRLALDTRARTVAPAVAFAGGDGRFDLGSAL